MEGKTKEQEKADFLAEIKSQNDAQIKEVKTELTELINAAKSGAMKQDEFDAKFAPISEKLEKMDAEKFAEFEATLKKYEDAVKAQGTEIAKLKEGGAPKDAHDAIWKEIEECVKSEKFQDFAKNPGRKVSFDLKTVSLGNDYTGDIFVSTRDDRVVDHPEVTRLNIRNLLTVMPADLPYLAFLEVYDWDRAVASVDENGVLAESSFKVRETSVDVKRIGTHIPISKRMLKSSPFIVNHLRNRLPAQVRYYEDFQFLWGDGQGNNLLGIFNVADDFATVINSTITLSAGDFASIESYDSGNKTLINFTANQDQLHNGDILTLASTDAGTYDGAFSAIVISPRQALIDQAYTADATVNASWTGVVSDPFKDSIEAAQQIDVLKVAKTLVTVQEYACTGICLNPVDATKIETLKGNDEHYLDVNRLENGILTIAGVPVVETTAMPAGKFVVGDWAMAAAIGQFTALTLEFAESVDQKLNNTVEAIIQEEVLFPIYNKYMFLTGDFTTAIAAIGV